MLKAKAQSKQQGCGELHGSHVVEGVVQLLADGLVLQFLGIQLIYCVVIIMEVAVKDLQF